MDLGPLPLGPAARLAGGLSCDGARACAAGERVAGVVEHRLAVHGVLPEKGKELLQLHPEGSPEPGEPERQRRGHDGQSRVADFDSEPEVDDRRRRDGGREAEGHARERAQAHLADDLLLVLADVLLNRYLQRHADHLRWEPGCVEHAEVDGGRDDDRTARDGRDGARDLGASLLLADGEAERDRAPHDEEPAEERNAARYERDYLG